MENLVSRAKMDRNVDHNWITELIKLIGLTKYTNQRYGTLSGGKSDELILPGHYLTTRIYFSWMSQQRG